MSAGDESTLFAWLRVIPAVGKVHGIGPHLCVHVSSSLSEASLTELLALCRRYHFSLGQFRQFKRVQRLLSTRRSPSFWWAKAVRSGPL